MQNFLHWHKANGDNENMRKEGRIWFFRSISGICECYPYLSPDKIRYAIDRLIKSGFLVKGNFSQDKMKKTNWYSLTDNALVLFGEGEKSHMDCENTERFSKIPNDSVNSQLNYSKETIDKENCSSSSIPSSPYQRGEGGDEEEKEFSGSPLPCGAEDRSGRASGAPKRKVAPKEKGEPWRESFDEYMKLVREGAAALKADANFRAEVERLQPNVDYDRTIDWCISQYWGTETGWEKKRRSRTKKIDMKATLRQNFDKNRIYKDRQASYSGGFRPRDVDTHNVNDQWGDIVAEQMRRVEEEKRRNGQW